MIVRRVRQRAVVQDRGGDPLSPVGKTGTFHSSTPTMNGGSGGSGSGSGGGGGGGYVVKDGTNSGDDRRVGPQGLMVR